MWSMPSPRLAASWAWVPRPIRSRGSSCIDTALHGYKTNITEERLRNAPEFSRSDEALLSGHEREELSRYFWRANYPTEHGMGTGAKAFAGLRAPVYSSPAKVNAAPMRFYCS